MTEQKEVGPPIPYKDSESFDYIRLVHPPIMETIAKLDDRVEANPDDLHAAFWLLYLERYSAMMQSARQGLDEEIKQGETVDIIQTHVRVVKRWLTEEVLTAVEMSKGLSFEEGAGNISLLALCKIDLKKIEEHEGTLLYIPSELIKGARPQPQNVS